MSYKAAVFQKITAVQTGAQQALMQTVAFKQESTGCKHHGVIAVTTLITILNAVPNKPAVFQKITAVQTGAQQALTKTAAFKQENAGLIKSVKLVHKRDLA